MIFMFFFFGFDGGIDYMLKMVPNSMQVVMPQNYYSKQMVGAQVDQVRCKTKPEEILKSCCVDQAGFYLIFMRKVKHHNFVFLRLEFKYIFFIWVDF